MTSRFQLPEKTWPFGRSTSLCAMCDGSGTNAQKVLAYMTSRVPSDRMTLREVQCEACESRAS
jgi:hypothetical protein